MRSDSLKARNLTEPSEYEKNIQLARDVAEVLRRNFAQAVRVDDEAGIWGDYSKRSFSQWPTDGHILLPL